MALNKVMLIGNLGGDPEVRYSPGGDPIASFRVATTEKFKRNGQSQEHTEWHRCVTWGKLAEIVQQYLKKGSQVYVEGSIRTRKWKDRDGQDKYTTEIKVTEMQMLGRSGVSEPELPEEKVNSPKAAAKAAGLPESGNDNDYPF